jgi:hypothetical protein
MCEFGADHGVNGNPDGFYQNNLDTPSFSYLPSFERTISVDVKPPSRRLDERKFPRPAVGEPDLGKV